MTTTTTPTPEQLDEATIDLIFALRDSLTDAGPSRLQFWAGRATSAIETAAAGSTTAGQAITMAARKLQIECFTNESSKAVKKIAALIDRDYEAWASHVAENLVYIVALANVARESRKPVTAKKTSTNETEKAPF